MASPYITIAELESMGLNAAAFRNLSSELKSQAILVACSEMEDLIAGRFSMPLATITPAMKMHLARAASYHLLFNRGFSPAGDDSAVRMGYEDALKYFGKIAEGRIVPSPAEISPEADDLPEVTCDELRGYDSTSV